MSGDTMLLYGRNSVYERLKADPKSVKRVFLEDGLKWPDAEGLIRKNGIPAERLGRPSLARLKPSDNLQGIAARIKPFEYTPLEEVLNQPKEKRPSLIFLDRVYDPQNLGAIIRSAACFGGFALVIPKYKACGVNETVLHVASGGENYVAVSMAPNLVNAITAAKDSGYWIMGGLIAGDAQDITKISIPFPAGLVLGSEGEGIRHGIERHIDVKVRIPMKGKGLSFNVAVAAAIFCHEISKQR